MMSEYKGHKNAKAGFLMNQLIWHKSEKLSKFTKQPFSKKNIFSASNFFMQITNVPVMWKQGKNVNPSKAVRGIDRPVYALS